MKHDALFGLESLGIGPGHALLEGPMPFGEAAEPKDPELMPPEF